MTAAMGGLGLACGDKENDNEVWLREKWDEQGAVASRVVAASVGTRDDGLVLALSGHSNELAGEESRRDEKWATSLPETRDEKRSRWGRL